MDLYHTWIYEHVINSKYLVWAIVIIVMGFNILAPIILWLTFSGRKLKLSFGKLNVKQEQDEQGSQL